MKNVLCLFVLAASLAAQTSYNVTLYGHFNKYGINAADNNYSEVWGWTDTVKNREYAFIGGPQGTSVVDITELPLREASLLIGPTTNNSYKYHEFRTYKNYLYIGSEGTDIAKRAGIQIVDLSTLPDSASFKKVHVWIDTNFTNNTTKNYYRAHTVSIEKHFLYVNGGDFGGTRILDLTDPLNPKQVGSYGKGSTPYVHDAIIRNDTLYAAAIGIGRMDIVDMTVKGHYTTTSTSKIVSKTATVPEGRTHQIWLSEDGNFAFVATETNGQNYAFNLHIYDIKDRTAPKQITTWTSHVDASIHNVFVKGEYLYIAYYTEGFRVLDISDPYHPVEVAFYDTYTVPTIPLFAGAWGVYPYFPSGKIAVSDMNTGLYIFNVTPKKGGRVTGVVRDAQNQSPLNGVIVTVHETGRKDTTDGTGRYEFGTAEGKHAVTFTKSGYIAKTETLTTKPRMLDSVNISLVPAGGTVNVEQRSHTPHMFRLSENYPNPFNPSTTISFSLPAESHATLRIYNSLGQLIATLIDRPLAAGTYAVPFDAANHSSGVYFYTLNAGANAAARKMVLSK